MANATKGWVENGITKRTYFTPQHKVLELPNLVGHLQKSWDDLVKHELADVFKEVSPIEDFTGQKLSLSFKDYHFGDPKITDREAIRDNTSYEAPLYANVELVNRVTGEVREDELYLGDYPWMTDRGTFIINGSERVVVSQLIRSSGVFFTAEEGADGRKCYGAKIIPGRGVWFEFETSKDHAIYVKIDRKRRFPVTTLLRALGYSTNTKLKELFEKVDNGEQSYIDATIAKDTSRGTNEALIEVFRKIRPGDLATVDNAKGMIERTFFDFKRFDISRVGRYKMNQRLAAI